MLKFCLGSLVHIEIVKKKKIIFNINIPCGRQWPSQGGGPDEENISRNRFLLNKFIGYN